MKLIARAIGREWSEILRRAADASAKSGRPTSLCYELPFLSVGP